MTTARIVGRGHDVVVLELPEHHVAIGDELVLDVDVVGKLVVPVVEVHEHQLKVRCRFGVPLLWNYVDVLSIRPRVREVDVRARYGARHAQRVGARTLHVSERDYDVLGRPQASTALVIRHAEREWRRDVLWTRVEAGASMEIEPLDDLGLADVVITRVERPMPTTEPTRVERLLRGELHDG